MRTTGNDVESNNQNVAQTLIEGSEKHFFRHDGVDHRSSDELNRIELRPKTLWSEYIEHRDRFGFDDKAKALKEKYFSLQQARWRNQLFYRRESSLTERTSCGCGFVPRSANR